MGAAGFEPQLAPIFFSFLRFVNLPLQLLQNGAPGAPAPTFGNLPRNRRAKCASSNRRVIPRNVLAWLV